MERTEETEDMTCPWDYKSQNVESEDENEFVAEEESESNWSEGSIEIDSSLRRPGGILLRFFLIINLCFMNQ